jgi:putative oxygen-independent coproporphyrinogen III oxidase
MKKDLQSKLGLYVHWPFCLSKCPYCDFNSYTISEYDKIEWLNAYLNQLNMMREFYEKNNLSLTKLTSIFFGGGTPSLMEPKIIEKIINKSLKVFGFNDDIEITLEANPSSIEFKNIKEFKSSGINRLSLGVQSLKNEDLSFLGRLHKIEDTKKIINVANKVFNNISIDLIYGLPFQNIKNWKNDLNNFFAYQLTYEKGTKFYHMYKKNDLKKITNKESLKFYCSTVEILENYNFKQYEISNFSKKSYQSKHNQLYWNSDNWFGIGPGAISRFWNNKSERIEIQNFKKPQTWIQRILKDEKSFKKIVKIESEVSDKEILIMGLRLVDGININKFNKKEFLYSNTFKYLTKNNIVKIEDQKIFINKADLVKLNYILMKITDTI